MQTAPPKPWERNGRRVTSAVTPAAASAVPAASPSPAADVADGIAATSSALTPSTTSYANTSSYGSSMYGNSMYGGYGGSMYGGGGYGGSMYGGGYGGYGGFGSMYGGGSMYGRGGMYGSGYGGQPGMYGNREQESQFFVPKMPEQPQDPANNRMEEIWETNSWFLDSVYSYGDRVYQFGRRLLDGLAKLQTAVSKGKVPPAVYRRAFTFAVTFGSVLFAALAHRLVRRHKQLAWDAYRRQVQTAALPAFRPQCPVLLSFSEEQHCLPHFLPTYQIY
ncbi:ABC transporter G family member 15 [Durusdinium trenchii]|uniref:ABC transporter G family member 15 n=1 Tax=Durusdinium trenchii TaxID=1381693 RepID=A0ABP0MA91_9DINO